MLSYVETKTRFGSHMTQYMIVYLGGEPPATAEEGKAHFEKYKQWLASLGDAAVSPANPLQNTVSVHPDRSITRESITGMSGYTLVKAESMEAALEMAKSCPFLDIGGDLEVSQLMEMQI